MPSMLDPHVAEIESWIVAEPQLTAIAILARLSDRVPVTFGPKQHSIVQRLLKTVRTKAAHQVIAGKVDVEKVATHAVVPTGKIGLRPPMASSYTTSSGSR
jgi:hypothetical protein